MPHALTDSSSKGQSSERVFSPSCAMEINGYYKVLHLLPFMQVRKSTQLTAYASATTCLGTGKSVGVLCKTAQKRGEQKKCHYN